MRWRRARGAFSSPARGRPSWRSRNRDENRAFTIGYEMADAGDKSGLTGTFQVLKPARGGAEVIPHPKGLE